MALSPALCREDTPKRIICKRKQKAAATQPPHPEEARRAVSKGGQRARRLRPTLRDGPSGLLRVRRGVYRRAPEEACRAPGLPRLAAGHLALGRRVALD